MKQITLYIREDQFEKLENEGNKSEVMRKALDEYWDERMNKEKFWDSLTEREKEMVQEICNNYAGSDGIKGRIFELYEEGAYEADMSLEKYSKVFSPSQYVRAYYDLRNQ